MNKTQLADKVNVTVSAVSYWESGRCTPTHENIEAMCELAFEISMSEFYGELPSLGAPAT